MLMVKGPMPMMSMMMGCAMFYMQAVPLGTYASTWSSANSIVARRDWTLRLAQKLPTSMRTPKSCPRSRAAIYASPWQWF
eukprot:6586074-Pyramimonas_sp.AAC.2